jgi:DNA-binding CsgD family transcriptional regulator
MWFLAPRSLVHLGCGRTGEALADAEEHALGIGGHQGYPVPVSWWASLPLARAANGDDAGAARAAREFVARERVHAVPARIAVALRAQAAVEPDQRIALLEQSVQLHETGAMRLEQARSCVDLGVAYRRDGQRTAARAVLERGAVLALGCQAGPLLETARSELRVLGARPRRAAFSGVESLTASERRVVDLAATGATNREIAEQLFVTMKTVESHLARAYRKLDITSRDGLAVALG